MTKVVCARWDKERYFSPRAATQFVAAGGLMQCSFITVVHGKSLFAQAAPAECLIFPGTSSCQAASPAAHEMQGEAAAALLLQTHLSHVHIAREKQLI